jgi:hypothetical protein
MNYKDFSFAARKILKYEATDTAFDEILPRMIEYGELRIYLDFDFLSTLASQATTLTANNRNVVLPANVIVCQSLNVITPASQTSPDLGTRNPVNRVGVDFLNALYTSAAGAAVPEFYAVIGQPTISGGTITAGAYNILLGPFPDQAYTLETIGTVRPTPLSSANATTFISTYCPHLFVAACMVFGFGYQRDFGGQSDNPQTAQSWENQYQALKTPTLVEELRRKSAEVSWSPYFPTPPANTPREVAGATASA